MANGIVIFLAPTTFRVAAHTHSAGQEGSGTSDTFELPCA